MVDRASARVAAGLFFVIIFMLVGLGLLAWMQMPIEVATAGNTVNTGTNTNVNTGAEPAAADNASDAEAESEVESEVAAEAAAQDAAEAEQADAADVSANTGVTETTTAETATAQVDDASANDAQTAPEEVGETEDSSASAPASTAANEASLTTDELVVAFATGGCSACHLIPNIAGAVGQLGPDLSAIGTIATSRVEGQSAAEYIHQSILEPDAYFVQECPMGPCNESLDQTVNIQALSDDELNGIIRHLLALPNDPVTLAVASAGEETTESADTPAPAEPASIDMEAVAAVVTKGTCSACHVIPGIDSAVGVLGPNLATIGTTAATRIEGYTAEEYIRESIMDPNAFIAPECPTGDCLPNIMLPNLAELLTEEEIDTIINYLATLDGQG